MRHFDGTYDSTKDVVTIIDEDAGVSASVDLRAFDSIPSIGEVCLSIGARNPQVMLNGEPSNFSELLALTKGGPKYNPLASQTALKFALEQNNF